MERGVLIDGSNLLHRIYYSKVGELTTSDGTNSGLVFGFLKTLNMIKNRIPNCRYCIVLWDYGQSRFRSKIFSNYKGYEERTTRTPEEQVRDQLYGFGRHELHKCLPLLNVPSVLIDGVEADDLIGWMAIHPVDIHWTIWSEDGDMCQLMSPRIDQYAPMTNKHYDYDSVLTEYGIVECEFTVFCVLKKAITGDGDVGGVSGIGAVNANRIAKKIIRGINLDANNSYDNLFKADVELVRRNIELVDIRHMVCHNYDFLKSVIHSYFKDYKRVALNYPEIGKLIKKFEMPTAMNFVPNILGLNLGNYDWVFEEHLMHFTEEALDLAIDALDEYVGKNMNG